MASLTEQSRNLFRKKQHNTDEFKESTFLHEFKTNKGLYFMLVPYFALFLLMVIIPIIICIALSFTYYNMFEPPHINGISNYVNIFVNDDIFFISLRNTVLFAAITGPISFFLCFLVAWFINDLGKTRRVFLTFVFYAPSLCSAVYFIWQFLFSGDSFGIINGFLLNVGAINEPIQWFSDPQYNLVILMIVQVWMSLGTGFLAFIAGFQSVDHSLYESAAIDGIRNRYQELFYITIPIMKPQLVFGAVMQIAASFAVSTISIQLCGFPSTNYSAHTLVLHILDYSVIRYEMGYACAVTVVLFIVTLLFKKIIDMAMRYISSEE